MTGRVPLSELRRMSCGAVMFSPTNALPPPSIVSFLMQALYGPRRIYEKKWRQGGLAGTAETRASP